MKHIFLVLFFFSCSLSAAKSAREDPMLPWGADQELVRPPRAIETAAGPTLRQRTCVSMIRFFQVYISPIDGPRSSFYPTSSQYALLAIQKHGVLKGIAMGCDRLMRENKDTWVYPVAQIYGTERKIDPVR